MTNAYIVEDNGRCVVIDVPFDKKHTLYNFIKEHNYETVAILLTHGHFDHVGGADSLSKELNAPIYLNARDNELAARASKYYFFVKCDDCHPHFELNETTKIDGFDIKVIETPGHTLGSVCIEIGDNLFTGDSLMKGTVGRTDFKESDASLFYGSLQKLVNFALSQNRPIQLYCGHYDSTTILDEVNSNKYLKALTND